MSDGIADKVTALGQRLKISGAEVGRKVTSRMSSMGVRMREFLQGPNEADQIVENATSENLDGPDWAANLEICDRMNTGLINGVDVIRAIKKRIVMKEQPRVQFLALVLLEACVKNCERGFAEVAAERVLDEMVRLIDDPETVVGVRNKLLILIEAWGESGDELRYLPVYEVTYQSLKSRGVQFPGRDDESLAPIFTPPRTVPEVPLYTDDVSYSTGHEALPIPSFTPEQTREEFSVARNTIELLSSVLSSSPQNDALEDDLTSTLVQQCRQSQQTIQKIIELSGSNDDFLLEALNINEELQNILLKYEELKKPQSVEAESEPATIPVVIELDLPHETVIRNPIEASSQSDGGDKGMMHHKDDFISL